jgi:hypothetical protein
MASSSSKLSVTSSNLFSNNTTAFFSIPSLQELVVVHIINQYDNVEAITEDLNAYIDIPILKTMVVQLQTQLNLFLGHVAAGALKQAEDLIIKANPKLLPALLSYKGLVVDDAGRTIYGTAWQIALGAKDVSIGKHEEMVEMIARYIKQLLNGEEMLTNQYTEQFPAGYEQQEEKQRKNDLAALEKIFYAIMQSKNDQNCEIAIKEFHDYLKKQTEGVITTGYHFNDQLFTKALKLYDNYYHQFGGYAKRKNNAAAIKVIGGIECYFTACLAQAASDGFGTIVDEKKQLSRSRLLSDGETPFFHPSLGVSHFVYNYYTGGSGPGYALWRGMTTVWLSYFKQKRQACSAIQSHYAGISTVFLGRRRGE